MKKKKREFNAERLGAELKKARLRLSAKIGKRITIAAAADMIGIGTTTLFFIEEGKRGPNVERLIDLLNLYDDSQEAIIKAAGLKS